MHNIRKFVLKGKRRMTMMMLMGLREKDLECHRGPVSRPGTCMYMCVCMYVCMYVISNAVSRPGTCM